MTSCVDPRVTLHQGELQGKILTSRGGRNILAFQGIPYAAPPVGEFRFKAPQEAPTWNGVRLAKEEGPKSMQVDSQSGDIVGQEDCLYINVYTPKLEREKAGLSVMVWIHGGGFYTGSGNATRFGPEFLLDHDVVLVTFNYRLGVYGYLSLGTPEAPGNYGLKDQVAALRWVQKNVAKFGGNPDSVTIFGESAGGASVHYLMLSPLARGLFHRAIAQSGSAHNRWSLVRQAQDNGHATAGKLGFEDQHSMFSQLQNVDSLKLMQASLAVKAETKTFAVFSPTIEPAGTEGAFLTEDPRAMLARGDIADVPLMAGCTTHEGYMVFGILKSRQLTVEQAVYATKANPARVAPSDIQSHDNQLAVGKQIVAFYENLVPSDPIELFAVLCTDLDFVPGIDELVRGVTALHRSPVYYYQFSYDGGRTKYKENIGIADRKGTSHMDELGYLFGGSYYPSLTSASPSDLATIDAITKIWTDFAKTGNPTPDNELGIEWKAVEAPLNEPNMATTRYLDIGDQLIMKEENLNEERVTFWRKLRETYQSNIKFKM